MQYSDNALKIYEKLYFNPKLNETSPEQVHERVANFIGNTEEEKEIFKFMMNEKIFRPSTPIMIHAGSAEKNDYNKALMACYTVGLEDTMESIIDMWKICSLIYASGAGAGIKITNLREKGSPLSSGGTSSGALAYLQVLEVVAQTVKSGGKHRRAANLAIFDYNHPDTLEILDSKLNGTLKAFNLSILSDNNFMDKIIQTQKNDEDFVIFTKSPNPIGEQNKAFSGKYLWDKLINNCWKTGDPGLLFFNRTNEDNPFPSYGPINVYNACSEIPLPAWSVCNLGSLNLSYFCEYNKIEQEYEFLFLKFETYIKWATIFLDNVIDKTTYIDEKFKINMKRYRPIGLGLMGFADILIKLKIPYNSKTAQEFFKNICRVLTHSTITTSIEICKNGKQTLTIPKKDKNHFENYLKKFINNDVFNKYQKYGIRNSTWTSIAPTGSIAISCDCSYSFEPLSAVIWQKELAETHEIMNFIHPEFEKWLDNVCMFEQHHNSSYKQQLIDKIIENNGSIQGIEEIPKEIQEIFITAHDIYPFDKIDMQAAGQEFISLGISSTCNVKEETAPKEIGEIFKYAYQKRLKGITIYRDKSLDWQPINFGKKNDYTKNESSIISNEIPRKRPIRRTGETFEIETPHGRLYLTLNKFPDGKPMEIFITLGKAGTYENLLLDTIARLISKNLRNHVPIIDIISLLKEVKEDKFYFRLQEGQEIPHSADSIIDAIGIIMEEFFQSEEKIKEWYSEETGKKINVLESKHKMEQCPECKNYTLNIYSGCKGGTCINCGYSNCI